MLVGKLMITKLDLSKLIADRSQLSAVVCPRVPNWVRDKEGFDHLWKNSYQLTSLPGPGEAIVIQGGIDSFGARYPSFVVSELDVLILRRVLMNVGVIGPNKPFNIHRQAHKCAKVVQFGLMTNTFNSRCTKLRWTNFDLYRDVFRNQCLRYMSFRAMKDAVQGKIVMTNVSLLLLLFGDCREHNNSPSRHDENSARLLSSNESI